MDWSKGYMSKCYITFVNENSWLDEKQFDITGGSIHRSDEELIESADIDCVFYPTNEERWIRIWIDAFQDGDSDHQALFTGLAVSPDRDIDGIYETNKVQCYSVLKPAKDILLPLGWYAPVEARGAELIRDLLSVGPAPVDIEPDSPRLKDAIIAESGESNLSMAIAITKSIDWAIQISGDGRIHVGPKEENVVSIFDSILNDIIEPNVTVSADWYNSPNVLRVKSSDGLVAIARDESDDSPYSIQNRGREVWSEESDVTISSDDTIGEYAFRKLKELQQITTKLSYNRRYTPEVYIGDRVEINYPAQYISGTYLITDQQISLGYNATTSEEAILV